jgi:uncharacterized protein YfaS (alpha-2-macroglobulin family)
MPALKWSNKAPISWFLFAIVISVAFLNSQIATDTAPVATYFHGTLKVTIPYDSPRAGAGQLSVDVLDPEDGVLAHTQKRITLTSGAGHWQEELKLNTPLLADDLIWYRLRYRFTYAVAHQPPLEGTESISQILRTPVVRVLGQQTYLAGGPAAIRVIVTDSGSQPIPGPGTVRIELASSSQVLYTGPLNRHGTTEAQFSFPSGLVGAQSLHYVVDTAIGITELTQPVRLEDKAQILLTTEKPLYQPGQTIHARALALDRSTHEASANRSLTLEVQDSRGNKVFKKATRTDEFGVAAADFALADEVNLGTYQLQATMDGASPTSQTTAHLSLDVERYVLPKFKVALELTGRNQHGYRPGDHVTGTIRANYFFGKSVENGEVTVKASTMDVGVAQVGSVAGRTDAEGTWHFDLQLPPFFAGRPLTQGAARVLVEATVKDSAAHSETRGEPITVSQSPILITAVPEGGTLVPNLENEVFLLTSYADGQPASTQVKVHHAGSDQDVTTDAGGVAMIRLLAGGGSEPLSVEAHDQAGNQVSTTLYLNSRGGGDQILLRTERAVYHAGDAIRLKVFSTLQTGTAYVDIVKEGQTILTRDLDLVHGEADLTVAATPDLAGTIDCSAYLIGKNSQPIADHRLAFIQPADELKIEATTDAAVYKPGDDARIHFRVTNSRGEGVRAAIGLQIVDEAVFALAQQQPGFAKVFFYLEQEVMKPRYEIHSVGLPAVLTTADASRDLAGRALFAATEMAIPNKFDREFGRTLPLAQRAYYLRRYFLRYQELTAKLADRLSGIYARNPQAGDLRDVLAGLSDSGDPLTRDAWGMSLRLTHTPYLPQDVYYLQSAGPDKQFTGTDDLGVYLQVHPSNRVMDAAAPSGKIDLAMEHDRGANNGLAEVTGTVHDSEGSVVVGASVVVRSTSTGRSMTAHSGPDGQFHFSVVLPGAYETEIAAPGFRTLTRALDLHERDRAILSVSLDPRLAIQRVTMTTNVPSNGQGSGGGIGNGKGGGVGFGSGGGIGSGSGGGVGGNVVRNFTFSDSINTDGPFTVKLSVSPALATLASDTGGKALLDANDLRTFLGADAGSSAPHVRSWFPESLYINPEIITDGDGAATIAIPLADNITTWRMAMVASTTHGALGSNASGIKVFQDFFADLDLPVTLTQGDRVSIPVGIYNYSGAPGDVKLHLQPADWYALVSDISDKTVATESGRVAGSQFTLEARRIGKFKLTLAARMTGNSPRADVLVREIEVVPNGREQSVVFNGRLENTVEHTVDFPAGAIADASKLFVRLYPGPLSQVIEGMDSILRMPGGCFEQTSSSTYPNVLALDYMKRTKKLTPEVHAKAEGYIASGYQRLLTFEVPGGGFSWFGQTPANKILTAYGLMEFSDMSKVYDVDPRLIQRTQQWLAAQQQGDGSWKPDSQFINEGATNRYNSDVLRITAYIAWSLENTGYRGQAVDRARQFVDQHLAAGLDSYTLAVIANFAADGPDHAFLMHALPLLMDARTENGDQISWSAEQTGVYGGGLSASIETTGLAVQALLKSGENSAAATKALAYVASKKDAHGAWGTTQATIMALRAVLLSTEKGSADVRGTLHVTLNGRPIQNLELTPENNDLLHQFVLKSADLTSRNAIGIRFEGVGALAYQVVGSYFLPWDAKPLNEPLSIDVTYDRSLLAQDDIATATAVVRNNLAKNANMVMVDLGIPPGFDLLSEDLQTYLEKSGRLQKFSLTATQAILYFTSFAPGETLKLSYRLRAKYPIRAQTFPSKVYEYYEPEINAVARPQQLEVRK